MNPMKRHSLHLAPLIALLASCGGGGSNSGGGAPPPGGSNPPPPPPPPSRLYVDTAGTCAGRAPCYSTIAAAVVASLKSQFDVNAPTAVLQHKRPNDPPDEIVVMPGTHRSPVAGRYAVLAGFNEREFPSAPWKLRITAEQGPALTTISGDGTGQCIWLSDYLDIVIKGFTISGCTVVDDGLVNELHAIYIDSYRHAHVRIEGNRIIGNQHQGAIGFHPYNAGLDQVQLEFVRNEMSGNHAGVTLYGYSPLKPTDSGHIVVANNLIVGSATSSASMPAKGIGLGPEPLTANADFRIDIIHNTVVGFRDFGIFVNTDAGEMNVQNNIAFGNRYDIYGGTARTNHNLVGETSNLFVGGNLTGDPLFVDAANGDYRLQPMSPAIDAGVASSNVEAASDFNGAARPVDGNRDGNAVPDIGAIEYTP
jgi:hypothetical protein